MIPSPIIELNRAVAVAMAEGPGAGLVWWTASRAGAPPAGYYLLPATRADLLRRLELPAEPGVAYRQALALATPRPSAATSPAAWPRRPGAR